MSLQEIIGTLSSHTTTGRGTLDRSEVGKLTTEELITTQNKIDNFRDGALSALHNAGDLISSVDEKRGGFDHNGAGWLVMHITDGLEAVLDLKFSIVRELNRRGYDCTGEKIKGGLRNGK